MKNWTKRYFVLTNNQKLTYYTDKDKKVLKGEINLKHVTEITTASFPDNCIVLIGKHLKRDYHLQSTKAKRKKWMAALKAISVGKPWPPKKQKKAKSTQHLQTVVQPVYVSLRSTSAPVGILSPPIVSPIAYYPVGAAVQPMPMYGAPAPVMYNTAAASILPKRQHPPYVATKQQHQKRVPYGAQIPQHARPPPTAPTWDGSYSGPPPTRRAEGVTISGSTLTAGEGYTWNSSSF